MERPSTEPITQLIQQLRSSDHQQRSNAQDRLIEAYSQRLLAKARATLGKQLIRKGVEAQAIADTALRAFVMSPNSEINNRDSLWNYLSKIVLNKVHDARRYHTAQERHLNRESDSGRDDKAHELHLHTAKRPVEQQPLKRPYGKNLDVKASDREPDECFTDDAIQRLRQEPDQISVAIAIELIEILNPRLQQIALLKFEGYSNDEIATRLGLSDARTVRRALHGIRERWSNYNSAGDSGSSDHQQPRP